MAPDIVPSRTFAPSSPPPLPVVLSIWATDVPAKLLRLDIPTSAPFAVPSMTEAAASFIVTAGSSAPAPAERDASPPSPLTEIDDDSDTDSTTDSESAEGKSKIARPAGVARINLPGLFPKWPAGKLEQVQAEIKKLTKIHLDMSKNFKQQDRANLKEVYAAMKGRFPFLKNYSQDWATHAVARNTIYAVNSALNQPAAKATRATPVRRTRIRSHSKSSV
ncbi:hypothetical protein DFH09DRAFT_1446173 [Mycena vulgaris]|nr:hypothetical protein DFH09DRAFT_1446173 [Mycena vulgaris]